MRGLTSSCQNVYVGTLKQFSKNWLECVTMEVFNAIIRKLERNAGFSLILVVFLWPSFTFAHVYTGWPACKCAISTSQVSHSAMVMAAPMVPQRVLDAVITSTLRQNNVAASFSRNNDFIFASCVRWGWAVSYMGISSSDFQLDCNYVFQSW